MPASTLVAGYQQAYNDMLGEYWDSTSNNGANSPRIRPTDGGSGLLISDSSSQVSFWQMSQYHTLLYSHWRVFKDAATENKIAANWQAVKNMYAGTSSTSGLGSDGSGDGTVYASDDGAWKLLYLCQVHEVTGDAAAVTFAAQAFRQLQLRFKDPNTTATYGSITASQYGMLYAVTGSGDESGQFGVSSLYEVGYALVALYIAKYASVAGVSASDFTNYAAATWAWMYKHLRYNSIKGSNPDNFSSTANYSGATGIYFCDLDIKPYVLSNLNKGATNTSTPNRGYLQAFGNGGSISAGAYQGGTDNADTQYGPPVRGNSASFSGGMFGMGVLSARLYALTGTSSYLQECQSIAQAFWQSNAFGRSSNLLCNERDPFTEGQFYPLFAYEVLGLSGVDPQGTLSTYMQATGTNILNTCIDTSTGSRRYTADWAGPESSTSWPPNTNTSPTTWQAQYVQNGNAGQAGFQQIMPQANTVLALLAGAFCSGMNLADATESAAGLESTLDQAVLDQAANTTPKTASLTPTPSSGSFGSASYNVTYLEFPNRLIGLSGLLKVSSVGSASGTVILPLPVAIANAPNGTGGVVVRGFDYDGNVAVDIASISPTELRLQTTSGSGTPFTSGSYICFQCAYQGVS